MRMRAKLENKGKGTIGYGRSLALVSKPIRITYNALEGAT